jgi:hypothetical protein
MGVSPPVSMTFVPDARGTPVAAYLAGTSAAFAALGAALLAREGPKGRQHHDDNGRAGSVHAGLARLFRLLRNAEVLIALTRWVRCCARRPAAAVALGTSPGAKPSLSGSPMSTSNRSVSRP